MSVADDEFRAGFACFVGRPNAGKSTLTNAIVGQKIAITSSRPQTTRHIVRGVLHRPDSQLVLVDTPGLHRPGPCSASASTIWSARPGARSTSIGLCIPADEQIGKRRPVHRRRDRRAEGDRRRGGHQDRPRRRGRLAEQLMAVTQLGDFADIVPVSAVDRRAARHARRRDVAAPAASPQLYPDGMLTDEPEQVLIAELIREAALEGVRDELPHSIAVLVEEMIPRGRAAT